MKINLTVKSARDFEALLKMSGLYYLSNGKPRFTTTACEKILDAYSSEEMPIAFIARSCVEYTPEEVISNFEVTGCLDFEELCEYSATLLENGNWLFWM